MVKKALPIITFLFLISFTSKSQELVKMQREYDATRARIAATKVDIECLNVDQKNVEGLKRVFYRKLHELDSNLTISKNYKVAGQQLDELIRLFYEDPEMVVINRNYFEFKEADDLRKELLKDKTISLKEYEDWRKKVLDKYKSLNGANYNRRNGIYNSMDDILLNISSS